MKSTTEPLEGNKVKLSIEVDEHEFEAAVDAVVKKLAREVRIPGFRPGKAPRRLLEARMGKGGLRQEALRESLPEFYAKALAESEVDAIAPPEIDITGGEDTGPLAFDAVVEVRPRVSIAGYQGLQATVPGFEVTDEDLDRQIDRLRQPFGKLNLVDRAGAPGDHASINIKGKQDGNDIDQLTADDFMYEIGSGGIAAELDDKLVGAKAGDTVQFTSDMGAEGGDTIDFEVLVNEVKELVLPEPTDEWAQEASEFETLAELRDDLRTRMGSVKKVQTSMAIRDGAIEALTALVADEPPEPLVNAEMESRLHDLGHRLDAQGASITQYLQATGQDQDTFVAELREGAIQAVQADLALRALAEDEGIDVTDEDVALEIERLGERMEQSPAQIRAQLDRSGQLPAVRLDIRKAKALAWLVENVEVIDTDGNAIDRDALAPTPEETGAIDGAAQTDTDQSDQSEADRQESE
ncbi:MAG: trigger factor [Acidimicrobiales bacterium]